MERDCAGVLEVTTPRVLTARGIVAAVLEGEGGAYADTCGYLDHHLPRDVSVGDIRATLRAYAAVVEAARDAVMGCPRKDVTWGPYSRPMLAVWAVPHDRMVDALAAIPEDPKRPAAAATAGDPT